MSSTVTSALSGRTFRTTGKQLIAALFETVKVAGGRIVSVQPKAAAMPLVAVTMTDAQGKDWRSRPGSAPPVFGQPIVVEGLEDVIAHLIATA